MDRRALLIGSQTHGLRGVHDDVASMRDALAGFGFQARTLVGEQAGYDGIVDAYRALIADTADGDAVVVYYSGHGARYRNPLAARDPDSPAWLQYLVPTDLPGAAAGTFRGVLAEELSLLQSALTARTGNVTTILDCCHAARMSRNPLLRPRSPARPGAFPWAAVRGAWERLRADARPPCTPGPARTSCGGCAATATRSPSGSSRARPTRPHTSCRKRRRAARRAS
ncbi:caspase family protein [Dactylosporangium sp. NBC_01737]|uniref:caspase family protein n=1 Tax=Dactylosporangium sp. NBC_01737 TaxID=2975959 RepID=UPI002E15BC3C|nr:caspase family protein [Dactylosporangium sp. NBC_01737]